VKGFENRPALAHARMFASWTLGVALILSGSAAAVGSGPLGVPVTAPPEEQRAIQLDRSAANPSAEIFEQLDDGQPFGTAKGVVANFGGPERWVRNVSHATLSAFRPTIPATGAAMVVVPGGGFMQLAIDREGYAVAKWLNERGIVAFVLKYRTATLPTDAQAFLQATQEVSRQVQGNIVPGHYSVTDLFPENERNAMLAGKEDGLAAIRYIRTHASQYSVRPNRIGIMGFSAGAAIAIAVALSADPVDRPDLVAPIYGLLPNNDPLTSTPPPAFIAAAGNDALGPGSVQVYDAWHAGGGVAELHVFEDGGHGFGVLHQGKSSDQWVQLFDSWLATHGFSSSPAPYRPCRNAIQR
jgi:acetyl esterase/lipase